MSDLWPLINASTDHPCPVDMGENHNAHVVATADEMIRRHGGGLSDEAPRTTPASFEHRKTVFVVFFDPHGEGGELIGVCASHKLADSFVAADLAERTKSGVYITQYEPRDYRIAPRALLESAEDIETLRRST